MLPQKNEILLRAISCSLGRVLARFEQLVAHGKNGKYLIN
jgi:hypothetical protein